MAARSAAARLLRLWVRILPRAWMSVCCECCVLSGRGLCDEVITRPEESYRLWCVIECDLETSGMGSPWPTGDSFAKWKEINYICQIQYFSTIVNTQNVQDTNLYLSNSYIGWLDITIEFSTKPSRDPTSDTTLSCFGSRPELVNHQYSLLHFLITLQWNVCHQRYPHTVKSRNTSS